MIPTIKAWNLSDAIVAPPPPPAFLAKLAQIPVVTG